MKTPTLRTIKSSALVAMAIIAGTFSPMALADSDYNFIQAHALRAEYADIPGFTLKGYELRAGLGWENFFTEFRYRDLSDTPDERELDESRWNLAIGYVIPITIKTRLDFRLNYGKYDVVGKAPDASLKLDPSYEGISSYVYHAFNPDIEVYGGLEWQNLPDDTDQKAYHLGAMYNFADISVGAEYTKYSDTDAMSLFVRYEF